jgi:hypothetical protein
MFHITQGVNMNTTNSGAAIFKRFIDMISSQRYGQQRAFLKAHRELQYTDLPEQQSTVWRQKLKGTLEDRAAFHKFLPVLRYTHEYREG